MTRPHCKATRKLDPCLPRAWEGEEWETLANSSNDTSKKTNSNRKSGGH